MFGTPAALPMILGASPSVVSGLTAVGNCSENLPSPPLPAWAAGNRQPKRGNSFTKETGNRTLEKREDVKKGPDYFIIDPCGQDQFYIEDFARLAELASRRS